MLAASGGGPCSSGGISVGAPAPAPSGSLLQALVLHPSLISEDWQETRAPHLHAIRIEEAANSGCPAGWAPDSRLCLDELGRGQAPPPQLTYSGPGKGWGSQMWKPMEMI